MTAETTTGPSSETTFRVLSGGDGDRLTSGGRDYDSINYDSIIPIIQCSYKPEETVLVITQASILLFPPIVGFNLRVRFKSEDSALGRFLETFMSGNT